MLTLKEGQYILGTWFVGHDEEGPGTERSDWFAICLKDTLEGPWRLYHRVCRHGSAGAPDQRMWEEAHIDGAIPEAQVLDALEQAAMRMAQGRAAPLHSVYIQGDVHRAFALLQAHDWFQVMAQE